MKRFQYKILILLAVVISFVNSCSSEKKKKQDIKENNVEEIEKPRVFKYGLEVDSFYIDSGAVEPNQSLTHILPKYGIDQATIFRISEEFDSIFDVRKIKPNHNYFVFCTKDSSKKAQCFIYEKDPIEYVVFNFADTLNVHVEQKDVIIKEKSAGGTIESSLWNAFVDNGLSPALVIKMAKLYAWTIDFFGLQKGDYFKIIYDAKYVENDFIGVGEIKAVLFNHNEKPYYIFAYETDTSELAYYTEEGKSIKRALLSAPLEYTRISSRFSESRFHPVHKYYRPHHGVDYAAPIGTEVVATGSGKVIFAGWAGDAGRLVKIKHTTGDIVTKYMHLSKFGPGIKKGVAVMQGQKIGEVGSTGASTGPHLDYRIFIHGKAVDPLSIDIPTKDPLKDSALIVYQHYIQPIKAHLDSISISQPIASE